jgi:hypothetical protein
LPRSSKLGQLAFLFAAFASATLVAKLFDAGWGTAASFGQLAFVAAVVAVLMTAERTPG